MIIGEKTAKKLYQQSEKRALNGFEKVSNYFIAKYFAKDGEQIVDTKERLKKTNKSRY